MIPDSWDMSVLNPQTQRLSQPESSGPLFSTLGPQVGIICILGALGEGGRALLGVA